MIFTSLEIPEVILIKPVVNEDPRGFFMRAFCKKELKDAKINFTIAQINQSLNKKKCTIRGLHYQAKPKQEAKIIQCLRGEIFDVAVDTRENSPTFGKWVSVSLSEKNHFALYIPEGFAHGYQTLTDNCILQYLMSEFYDPKLSRGIRWDDPSVMVKWPLKVGIISDKDKKLPTLK